MSRAVRHDRPARTLDLLLSQRPRLMPADLACDVLFLRGAGPAVGEASNEGRVSTVTRGEPALVALDAAGVLLERIEV